MQNILSNNLVKIAELSFEKLATPKYIKEVRKGNLSLDSISTPKFNSVMEDPVNQNKHRLIKALGDTSVETAEGHADQVYRNGGEVQVKKTFDGKNVLGIKDMKVRYNYMKNNPDMFPNMHGFIDNAVRSKKTSTTIKPTQGFFMEHMPAILWDEERKGTLNANQVKGIKNLENTMANKKLIGVRADYSNMLLSNNPKFIDAKNKIEISDVHKGNVGFRANGEARIIDPVIDKPTFSTLSSIAKDPVSPRGFLSRPLSGNSIGQNSHLSKSLSNYIPKKQPRAMPKFNLNNFRGVLNKLKVR